MMQSFQCTTCGHQNAFGEPACTQCGQPFIYSCPICGIHINNRYDKCRGCGAEFNWGTMLQQNHSDSIVSIPTGESQAFPDNVVQNTTPYMPSPALPSPAMPAPAFPAGQAANTDRKLSQPAQSRSNTLFSSSRFWVILIIICVVIIAILLVIDRLVSK
jgi:hypothetical protein